jgi:hypothetical protein
MIQGLLTAFLLASLQQPGYNNNRGYPKILQHGHPAADDTCLVPNPQIRPMLRANQLILISLRGTGELIHEDPWTFCMCRNGFHFMERCAGFGRSPVRESGGNDIT